MGNLKLRGKGQGVSATTKSCHFKDRPHSSLSMALRWDIYDMLIAIFMFLPDRHKRFWGPRPSTHHISTQGTLKREIEAAPGNWRLEYKPGGQSGLAGCWPSAGPHKRTDVGRQLLQLPSQLLHPSGGGHQWLHISPGLCFTLLCVALSTQLSLWVGGLRGYSCCVQSWWNSLPCLPLPRPKLELTLLPHPTRSWHVCALTPLHYPGCVALTLPVR